MGLLQNQNLTQPEVTHWESPPHLSSDVNNTIITLGALTFALQLCLALFFMLRCWRSDSIVREALKHPEDVNKLTAPSFFHRDIHEQASYQLYDDGAAASSPAMPAEVEEYQPTTISLFSPCVHWDLVQGP